MREIAGASRATMVLVWWLWIKLARIDQTFLSDVMSQGPITLPSGAVGSRNVGLNRHDTDLLQPRSIPHRHTEKPSWNSAFTNDSGPISATFPIATYSELVVFWARRERARHLKSVTWRNVPSTPALSGLLV